MSFPRRIGPLLRQVSPFLVVGAASILLVGIVVSGVFKRHYVAEVRDRLAREAELLSRTLAPLLAGNEAPERWTALADEWHDILGVRVTLIDTGGVVLTDSEWPRQPYPPLENHGTRPEVVAAVTAGQGWSVRYSATLGIDLLYAAWAVRFQGKTVGILRLAVPLAALAEKQKEIGNLLLTIMTVAVILVIAWSAWISTSGQRSLARLAETATKLSGGDWSARVPIDPYRKPDEFSEVGHAFNRMADELQARYEQRRRERDQMQTVLSNMSDGVLAVDERGVIRLVNSAFLRFFRTTFDDPLNHTHSEAFRYRELNELIDGLLSGSTDEPREVEFTTPAGRVLVILAAPIIGVHDADVRGVLVARDVTARRRTERMRRDFVANVSHELRTPLTAILGYVEALRDRLLPESDRAAFLETISRNAVRMNNIVGDLLELSRIENADYRPRVTEFPLGEVIDEVRSSLYGALEQEQQSLTVTIAEKAGSVRADRDAVVRILSNLVDNAHKYTPAGGHITISAAHDHSDLVLEVADDGIGVPTEDRGRLFERFFRVDRARSRASGGTGLGLAIVKHLAEAHRGVARYEANVPRGSRLIVRIPQDNGPVDK